MKRLIKEVKENEFSHDDNIRKLLLTKIPLDKLKSIPYLSNDFLGFIDIYYYLSKVIPKSYTIIDFGAGYNAQSYFFDEHKEYISVEPEIIDFYKFDMFRPSNCKIYNMTTKRFLESIDYPKENVFAICNYVPKGWYGQDSIDLVKKNFRNVYTFYPEIKN